MLFLSSSRLLFFLSSSSAISVAWAAVEKRSSEGGARPRGVGPDFAKFYKTPSEFTCISNPAHKIPFSQVNDDYCDCADGSDEPGTSACSHLSPLSPDTPSVDPSIVNVTNALPGFYCKNKGHLPSYLPFTSVNDGKCDYTLCCDGSDEWASAGGKSCPDKCKEIGKEWRRQDEARTKAQTAAMKRRRDLVAEASRLRLEVEHRIETLLVEVQAREVSVASAEKVLEDTEKAEKLKVVAAAGVGKGGGRTAVLAGLAKARVEELRSNLITVRTQRDVLYDRVVELETMLATLKEDYNPNFNDDGVKRAVRAWEDYAARGDEVSWEDAQDRDLDEISKPDGEGESGGINWAEWEQSDETDEASQAASADSDLALLQSLSAYLPPSLRAWIEIKLTNIRQMLVENGILADPVDPSTAGSNNKPQVEPAAVASARNSLNSVRSELTRLQKDLSTQQSDLDKDYGPDDIFRAMSQLPCVTKDSGEYIYELCFWRTTKQKTKRGGGDTNMGNFVRLDSEMVDEDISAEGKGLGRGKRIVMRYEGGQHCWNGPSRSTIVVLACAENDEIWKVSESEKCVYRMEVGTAAVCESAGGGGNGAGRKSAAAQKDEL